MNNNFGDEFKSLVELLRGGFRRRSLRMMSEGMESSRTTVTLVASTTAAVEVSTMTLT
ncbi:MAG: hypothetical protein Q8S73_27420 [Deltaproteobacteria bacterium]|nr:hypothetical protein [Deltaproteobacteria bacterium]